MNEQKIKDAVVKCCPEIETQRVICSDCEGHGKELCNNPDHNFISAMPGDISRLGCPVCGNDYYFRTKYPCEACGGEGFILSSPITLAHILRTLEGCKCDECNGNGGYLGAGLGYAECNKCGGDRYLWGESQVGTGFIPKDIVDVWDLTHDSLSAQSEQCKEFLATLLSGK